MATIRHIPMKKMLCTNGCGHMAAGGDHGYLRIKLAEPALTEEEKGWVLFVYGDPRAKISEEGKAVLIPKCPPSRGIRGDRRLRSRARRRQARQEHALLVARGAPVVGTGKPSASSKGEKT